MGALCISRLLLALFACCNEFDCSSRICTCSAGRASQGADLLRQVMATSSQQPSNTNRSLGSWKPFSKPSRNTAKSKQGPSKLDALFSQLQTPAKGARPSSQGLPEKVVPALPAEHSVHLESPEAWNGDKVSHICFVSYYMSSVWESVAACVAYHFLRLEMSEQNGCY